MHVRLTQKSRSLAHRNKNKCQSSTNSRGKSLHVSDTCSLVSFAAREIKKTKKARPKCHTDYVQPVPRRPQADPQKFVTHFISETPVIPATMSLQAIPTNVSAMQVPDSVDNMWRPLCHVSDHMQP